MDRYKFIDGVFVYFVTFTITDWLPVFIHPEPIEIIIESLNFCVINKGLRINSYVIMPNHIHLILFDADFNNKRLQQTITSFRKFSGAKLADYIDQNLPGSLSTIIRSKQLNDRERQVWQPGWHAEGIASEEFWQQKVDYIHMNPVRQGFVRNPEDWAYSSAAYWLRGENSNLLVFPIALEDS